MTQNKLDGPQSSKLCKTFKLTKREREGKIARQAKIKRERLIRQSLGGHGMHRRHTWVKRAEDMGWMVEVHHMHFKAGLFIMHD